MSAAPPTKVLVVDDDRIVLEVVKDVLEEGGFTVVTLQTPQLIATVLERERPRLMLVDVQMPDVDGGDLVAFVRRFRRRYVEKIVLLSAESEERLRALTEQVGADGFIRKGDRARLLAEVRRFLEPNTSVK